MNLFKKIILNIYDLVILMISMSGFVVRDSDIFRFLIMALSLATSIYLSNYETYNLEFAIYYFLTFAFLYVFVVTFLLSENGYRNSMINKFGEKKAYHLYQTLMGFLFFHNGVSLGYVASSSPSNIFDFLNSYVFYTIVVVMFCIGFIVKVWSAKVVGIDIYYWKDMFTGRKVGKFVASGPYKILSNPMYGVGQLQGYALAIWHQSSWGILAAILNQAMVFLFFYCVEIKFINRVYKTKKETFIDKELAYTN